MTGISSSQLNDIINVTLVDLPMPTVVDLLCAGGEWSEWEVDLVVKFIKDHYTKDEILAGIHEFLRRCEFMSILFKDNK